MALALLAFAAIRLNPSRWSPWPCRLGVHDDCQHDQLRSVQSQVPDMLRGRVMGIYTLVFFGMTPLGSLAAGVAAAQLGEPATVHGGGVAPWRGGLALGSLARPAPPALKSGGHCRPVHARVKPRPLDLIPGTRFDQDAAVPRPGNAQDLARLNPVA